MQPTTEPIITLHLPLGVVNFILAAMGELPAKNAMGPIQTVTQQAQAQMAALNASQTPPAANDAPVKPDNIVPFTPVTGDAPPSGP